MRSQGDRCPRLLHPTKRAMSYSWTEWGTTLHSADNCICVIDSSRDHQSNVFSTKWNVHYFGLLVEGTVVWKGWVSSNPSAKLFSTSPSLCYVNTVRIDELVRYYVLKKTRICIFRIPFTLAGTVYGKYLAVDLGTFALKGLFAIYAWFHNGAQHRSGALKSNSFFW